MFENLRSRLFGNQKSKGLVSSLQGSYSNYSSLTPTWDKGSVYDNSYASIKAIANAFVEIRPYAVNERGKEVKCPAVEALYSPNDRMDGALFREALAVMTMTHQRVFILVHHKYKGVQHAGGANATPDNIVGYTFLENVGTQIIDGKRFYLTGDNTYSEQDVIELSVGVNPYNLATGYSPATAVKKWASVDDYIVAYEAGLFENGAVPAGQFIITAKDSASFKDIVAEMQRRHRGSGRNNNVQYVYKPIDPATGQVQSAQVEWQSFSQSNSNLALSDIFAQVNEKLDSAYGVPASIRGVSTNNNYASAQVDEAHFMKFTIKPLATKIWGLFTHELNRITGGLGCAITFDVDDVIMADEMKTIAETKRYEAEVLEKGLSAGYSAEQIIAGFGLDIDYEALGEPKTIIDTTDNETSDTEPAVASESKKKDDDWELAACKCGGKHKKAELKPSEQAVVDKLEKAIADFTKEQIEKVLKAPTAKKDISEYSDEEYEAMFEEAKLTEEEKKDFSAILFGILSAYILVAGGTQYRRGVDMITSGGGDASGASGYKMTVKFTDSYEKYLNRVAGGFLGDNSDKIKNILRQSKNEGWNKTQLAQELGKVVETDAWRIERLARNEERRAYTLGQLDSMIELQDQTGVKIVKKWHIADSGACDFCKEMDGKVENVSVPFLKKGDVLDADGAFFEVDFTNIESAQLHANCRCVTRYELEA